MTVGSKKDSIEVPARNSTSNLTMADVIGNKTDSEAGNSLYSLAHIIEMHMHSASKVYPTLADEKSIAKANSSAWGEDANPTEIIPVNTVTDYFDIHYIDIGAISALDQYELALFSGLAGAEVEIGRTSFSRTATSTEESIPIMTPLLAPNTRISAKLTSKATASRSITLKLFYHTY